MNSFQPLVVEATILGSQGVIQPNTVLGIVTASGKMKIAASGSSDGSQTLAALFQWYHRHDIGRRYGINHYRQRISA